MTQHKAHPTPPAVPDELGVIELARRFHDYYEEMAPRFGYKTRAETRNFDQYTPNGRLMIAVCRRLRASLAAPVASNTTAEPAPIQPAGVEVDRDVTEWKARYEARELEAHQLSEQIIKLRRFEQAAARYYWLIDNRSEYVWNNCLYEDETRGCFDVDAAIDQALAAASQGDRGKT